MDGMIMVNSDKVNLQLITIVPVGVITCMERVAVVWHAGAQP